LLIDKHMSVLTYYSCASIGPGAPLNILQSYLVYDATAIGLTEFALHIYQYYTSYFAPMGPEHTVRLLTAFFTNQFPISPSALLPANYTVVSYDTFFASVFYALNTISSPQIGNGTFTYTDISNVSAQMDAGKPFYTPMNTSSSGWSKPLLFAVLIVGGIYLFSKNSRKSRKS
jgi:hypothetical protein